MPRLLTADIRAAAPRHHHRNHSRAPDKRRLITALALALLMAGAAGGCSSGTSGHSAPSGTSAPPAAANNATTPPGAAQLKAALLAADDLGTSFTVVPTTSPSPTATASGSSGCPQFDQLVQGGPTQNLSAKGEQAVTLTGGSEGPFVYEALLADDPASVTAAYAQLSNALHSCTSLTVTPALTFTLSPINFAGPNSTAVRMDGELQGVQVTGYLAIEPFDTVLLVYAFYEIGGGSSQLASAYYTQAGSKLEKTLGVR